MLRFVAVKAVGDETDDLSTMPSLGRDETVDDWGSYLLTVTNGPDRGLSLKLSAARPLRALVGHSSACELRLSDLRTSRRHASIDLTRKGVRITDLASKNGTMVGPVRIVEALLTGGEDIRVGDTTIRLERSSSNDDVALGTARRFGRVIGASPAMRRLFPLCAELAAGQEPILIEGEAGTGKEIMAEALHEASRRASGPFVVFDCTSMGGPIMAELLCGHAGSDGAIQEANGGTLCIYEIGALDPAVQPRLVRLLEYGEVQPVGSDRGVKVDVRVIAATERNLDHEVQTGRFREDLFALLASGRLELPPLRDRAGDIGVLTRHFWRTLGGDDRPIPAGLVDRFSDRAWPGNVSELSAAVMQALAAGEVVLDSGTGKSTPPAGGIMDAVIASGLSLARGRARVVAEFERRYVQNLLEIHHGNVSRAAAASGLARRYFQLLKARHLKGS